MRACYFLILLASLYPAVALAQLDANDNLARIDTGVTAPLPAGDYMTGEQIKALVSGKTLNITDRQVQLYRGKPEDRFHYYQPDSMAYLVIHDSSNSLPIIDRGTWFIENNRLCTHGMSQSPCLGIRRAKGGHLEAVYPGKNNVWDIRVLDGDPKKTVETVNESSPWHETPMPKLESSAMQTLQ